VHARLASGLAFVVLAASAANADSHRWQRVLAGDRKVGQVEITRREAAGISVETETLVLELGAPGRRVSYRVVQSTESAADGALLRSAREVKTREAHFLVEARVSGDDLEVANGVGRAKSSKILAGAARSLKSDAFAHSWLAAAGRGESPDPLSFQSWDPVKLTVVEVTLRRLADADALLVERRVRSSNQPTASVLQIDAAGHVVRESMRVGSIDLVLIESSEAEARAKNEVLDHVSQQIQKAPYRIPTKDMRAKIRYGFDNHGAAPLLPAGAGQRTWTDGPTTFIQVCAECALDPFELSADDRQRALQPTRWLQSEDARLAHSAAMLRPLRSNITPNSGAISTSGSPVSNQCDRAFAISTSWRPATLSPRILSVGAAVQPTTPSSSAASRLSRRKSMKKSSQRVAACSRPFAKGLKWSAKSTAT